MNEHEKENKIKELDEIESAITPIDFSNFEPTDTEGAEIEGCINYEGNAYYVTLNAHSGYTTYEKEAAQQIYDELRKIHAS